MKETTIIKKYQNVWILAAILIITIFIYSNSIKNGFIDLDDPENIIDNVSIRQINTENIVHYFTSSLGFMYTPMAYISYAIDYQIAKLDPKFDPGNLNPAIFHLSNLMIHLINIILVFWLFQIFTGKSQISLFMAAIFAIHPVNVDGIAWLATRGNLLSTLFVLASLIAYTYYTKKDFKLGFLIISLVCFLLAGLTKVAVVVLPFILLLWDYFQGRKITVRLAAEKIPYFLISLGIGILAVVFRIDTDVPFDYNLLDRFILLCSALSAYFYRLLFPFDLSFAYAYPAKTGAFLPWYLYLTPFVLLAIVFVLFKSKLPKKIVVTGLIFFVINILVTQLGMFIDNYKVNRYAYLSYVGLFFILGAIHEKILSFSDGWKSKIKIVWQVLIIAMAIVFCILSFSRIKVWKDTITVLDDVVSKEPSVPWVYCNRGISKYKKGDYAGAEQDFKKNLELDPDYNLSMYYLGVLKSIKGDYKGAIELYDQAISLYDRFTNAYFDRGNAKLALIDQQGALEDFSKAIELNEYFVEAYFNRGVVRYDLGDNNGAIADYTKAIYYFPQYAEAYHNRGTAQIALGKFEEAIKDYTKSIELFPNYTDAYYNRGIAQNSLNNNEAACTDWKKAVQLGFQGADALIKENCGG